MVAYARQGIAIGEALIFRDRQPMVVIRGAVRPLADLYAPANQGRRVPLVCEALDVRFAVVRALRPDHPGDLGSHRLGHRADPDAHDQGEQVSPSPRQRVPPTLPESARTDSPTCGAGGMPSPSLSELVWSL
jgi:hypothetical protein